MNTEPMSELLFWLMIHRCPGVGVSGYQQIDSLIYQGYTFKMLWQSLRTPTQCENIKLPPKLQQGFNSPGLKESCEKEIQECEANEILLVHWLDPIYPQSLKKSHWKRPTLSFKSIGKEIHFVREKLLMSQSLFNIGMVGTRNISNDAELKVKHLLQPFEGLPVQIISGLAQGIDSLCHKQAIQLKIPTIGVLGSGILHWSHSYKSWQQGVILCSEYPPQLSASKKTFPQRNQIIAGYSSALMVVECRKRSGSLITYQQALEDGKSIWAHTGNWMEIQSEGPLSIISQGANPVREGIQWKNDLKLHHPEFHWTESTSLEQTSNYEFNPMQECIFEHLTNGPLSVSEINEKVQDNPQNIMVTIAELELMGLIRFQINGKWKRL